VAERWIVGWAWAHRQRRSRRFVVSRQSTAAVFEVRLYSDAGEEWLLILEIHGGPFANYGDRFTAEIQLYAAAGHSIAKRPSQLIAKAAHILKWFEMYRTEED